MTMDRPSPIHLTRENGRDPEIHRVWIGSVDQPNLATLNERGVGHLFSHARQYDFLLERALAGEKLWATTQSQRALPSVPPRATPTQAPDWLASSSRKHGP